MILNSEKFYNDFSKEYENYSMERNNYLSSVNEIIKSYVDNPDNMLDIGCGTGDRAILLSSILNIKKVILVDQSKSMLDLATKKSGFLGVKADIGHDIYLPNRYFKLITCLWNVLGHIGSEERCLYAFNLLKNKIDKESGVLIIDINNRYNILQYGFINVIKNIVRDFFHYNFKNGDFLFSVSVNNQPLKTFVHLFTPFEMRKLIKKSGLKIEHEIYVNYKNGKKVSSWLFGQMVYVIKI